MTIHFIRRYIHFLKEGEIFTTRDVLQFGMRAAVDKALSRLVLAERIRRLARGVFVKDSTYCKTFSDLEIATAKAQAFGRKILEAPMPVVHYRDPSFGKPTCDKTFYIDGHSSKFKIGDTTITFKHAAPRKLRLTETKAGEAARALWYLGPVLADGYALMNTVIWFMFFRDDYKVFRKNIRWMPAWLSDLVKARHWDQDYENERLQLSSSPTAMAS
jgi:Family of unknown function (DUF6088)